MFWNHSKQLGRELANAYHGSLEPCLASMGPGTCRNQVRFTHQGMKLTAYVFHPWVEIWVNNFALAQEYGEIMFSVGAPRPAMGYTVPVPDVPGLDIATLPVNDAEQVAAFAQRPEVREHLLGLALGKGEFFHFSPKQLILRKRGDCRKSVDQLLIRLSRFFALFSGQGAEADTPRIRKFMEQLTPADLEEYPVWEFCLDEENEPGQDETTVRPSPLKGPRSHLDPGAGMFAVHTEFTLANGHKLPGYLTPQPEANQDPDLLQPTLCTDQGQILLLPGQQDQAAYSDELAAQLKLPAEAIFPISYTATVRIKGGPVKGILEAQG